VTLFTAVVFGFFLGMSHALEADHLAAIASLSTRARSLSDGVRMGVAWGVGHTLTLFLFGSVVLLVHEVVPESLAAALELGVGIMLVALGVDVWRRLVRKRIHIHVHRHDDGVAHLHAHAHRQDDHREHAHAHDRDPGPVHHHAHPRAGAFPARALVVGLIHGMAGSAALVLLALERAPSVVTGLAYIALFGAGSIVGMAALSAVISVPLRLSATSLTRFHNVVEAAVGTLTLGVGLSIISEHLGVVGIR
jgi:ABC-type nickel/cobalt efflux system permease component RcnA